MLFYLGKRLRGNNPSNTDSWEINPWASSLSFTSQGHVGCEKASQRAPRDTAKLMPGCKETKGQQARVVPYGTCPRVLVVHHRLPSCSHGGDGSGWVLMAVLKAPAARTLRRVTKYLAYCWPRAFLLLSLPILILPSCPAHWLPEALEEHVLATQRECINSATSGLQVTTKWARPEKNQAICAAAFSRRFSATSPSVLQQSSKKWPAKTRGKSRASWGSHTPLSLYIVPT